MSDYRSFVIETPENPDLNRITFTFAIIALAAKLATCDGQANRKEYLKFCEVFPLEHESEAKVRQLFYVACDENASPHHYARQIAALYREKPQIRQEILHRLSQIAVADGVMNVAEEKFLAEVSAALNISRKNAGLMLAAHLETKEEDPYTVLNLPANASNQQVQRRYRSLSQTYHPDRTIARSAVAEDVRRTQARMAAINVAYQQICTARGMG